MSTGLSSWGRRLVEYLGEHPTASRLFFWAGFPTVRLVYPVQFLLLRELMDCGNVLDLGCGRHSMVPILPKRVRTVGVEGHEPHYREALAKARHTECVHADITRCEYPDQSFDAVVMLDVLEHLDKEDGLRMIGKMKRWARKKVVVFTPNGYLHQDEYDSNPLMAHRSGWSCEELRSMGFRVRGVRGLKRWYTDHAGHDGEEIRALDRIADLSQLWTYHHPAQAFQLFAVYRHGAD